MTNSLSRTNDRDLRFPANYPITVFEAPMLIEATARRGVTLYEAHGPIADTWSGAPRYAAYIQMARDDGDYGRADALRAVVESFGLDVRQDRASTTVRDGAVVRGEAIVCERKGRELEKLKARGASQ